MDVAGAKRTPAGGGDVDAPGIITGRRGRSVVEGVADSDISDQATGAKCRLAYLCFALAADKDVVKGRAQWWHTETKGEIGTQTRRDRTQGNRCYLRGMPEGATEFWGAN